MKVKKIRIGIKSVKAALDDFTKTGAAIERGQTVKKKAGTYFTSFEAFRKALTPKRLELLRLIKTEQPSSTNELARIAKRDIKNVVDDLKYLEHMGLIERAEENRRARPIVGYSRIDLEIAV